MWPQVFTDRHPDGKADPCGRRHGDHQKDVHEYWGERNPRYERCLEVKFDVTSRLANEQDEQTDNTDETTDDDGDGPPAATETTSAAVDHQDAQRCPDHH